MVTCKFDYIESSGVEQEKKDFFTELHIKAMRDIASRVEADDPDNYLFDVPAYKNGNKILVLQKFDDTDKQKKKLGNQRLWLRLLDDQVRKALLGKYGVVVNHPVIHFTDIILNPEKNDLVSTIVTVNFGEYLHGSNPLNVGELDLSDPENLKTFQQLYAAEMLKSEFIVSRNIILEELQSNDHFDNTLASLERMMNSIGTLKENIFKNKNLEPKFKSQENELERMYNSLKALQTLKDNPARVFAITQYVAKSYRILLRIEKSVRLDLVPRVRPTGVRTIKESGDDLREASTYLKEIYSLLEAISPLQDILTSVSTDSGFSFWQSYNELAIERELMKAFKDNTEDIKNVLSSEITSILELEQGFRVKGFTEVQIKAVSKIVTKNELESKVFIVDAFKKLSEVMTTLKGEIATLSYDTIAGQIYNQQLISMQVNNKDELTSPELIKAFKTKAEFVQLLHVTAKDINWWDKHTSGGSQIEDVVVRYIVQDLRNALILTSIQNTSTSTKFEEHLETAGLDTNNEVRKAWEKEFERDIFYLPPGTALTEAEADYTGPVFEKYGKKFKVRKGKALIDSAHGAYDGHRVVLDSKMHQYTVEERSLAIKKLFEKKITLSTIPAHILSDVKTLAIEKKISIVEGIDLKGSPTWTISNEFIYYDQDADFAGEIAKVLNVAFFKSTNTLKNNIEINDILSNILTDYDAKNVLAEHKLAPMLVELNNKESSGFFRYMKKNTTQVFTPDNEFSQHRMGRLLGNALTSGEDPGFTYVVGLNENDEFVQVKMKIVLNKHNGKEWVTYRIETKGITKLVQLKGDFNNINARYLNQESITLRNQLASNPTKKGHYDFIHESYKRSKENQGMSALPYNLLPFIPVEETRTLWQKVKSSSFKSVLQGAWDGLKYEEKNVRVKMRRNDDTGEYEMVDEEGNPTLVPVYIQKTDPDGKELLELVPRYTDPINTDDVETDLFLSMVLMETSSNSYRLMAEREATVNVVKVILKGNSHLGITARRAGKLSVSTNNALQSTANQAATTIAENSTEALISVMNTMMYGASDGSDTSVAGMSVKKLMKQVKGLTVYQAMAVNITAMFTNLGMGNISNFVAAAGKRLGLTTKALKSAYADYGRNIPNFLADFTKTNKKDQSLWTQFATYADAIKGAIEGNAESIAITNLSKKIGRNLLYLTSIAPEHMNQMVIFMGFTKSYKVLEGLTMEDILVGGAGVRLSFNLDKYNERARALNLPEIEEEEEFFEKVLVPFRNKLGKLMYEAHGQFDKLDANMTEKSRYMSLAYMFHRWVAPGIKARFAEGGVYSPQANEVDPEGYLLTYLKDMVFQNDAIMAEYENLAFVEKVKKYFTNNKLTTIAQIGATALGKTTIGIINKMSFNLLANNSPKIEEWLFGNKTDEVRERLERAYTEIAIYAAIFVLRTLLESLGDDDDEEASLRKIALLQLRRVGSDMGFFLNPITFSDKLKLKLQDPFSIRRSYETNSGFLKQLIGWNVEDGKIDYNFNDLYDRDGSGYEKGDSKLAVKFRKSALAPYNQIIKFLNPQQSLNFMDMTFGS